MGQSLSRIIRGDASGRTQEEKSQFDAQALKLDRKALECAAERDIPIPSDGIHIRLVPHEHTLFCERKSKVCTTMGKVQELETVEVHIMNRPPLGKPFANPQDSPESVCGQWMRSTRQYVDPHRTPSKWRFSITRTAPKDHRDFEPIEHTINQKVYNVIQYDVVQ
jgi:hypothetical protein